MSILKFGNAIQNKLFLKYDESLSTSIDNWEGSLIGSRRARSKDNKKSFLSKASLLLPDAVTYDSDNNKYVTSQFRKAGESGKNTIFVVTENNLLMQFKAYGLKLPSLDGKRIVPGEASSDTQLKGLLGFYIAWLHNLESRSTESRPFDIGPSIPRAVKVPSKKLGHIEYFTNTGKASSSTDTDITAVRQYGRPHTTTNTQMYAFLYDCGLTKTYSQYTNDWEIGHIESQAHGRLAITKEAGKVGGFIDKLIQLNQYLDLASSSMLPEYDALTAAIKKDFTGKHLFMNVEMQPKGSKAAFREDPLSNQGSGALSASLNFGRTLLGMFTTDALTRSGNLKLIKRNNDLIAVKLKELYDNYLRNRATVELALRNFKNLPPTFITELESSDNIREYLTAHIVNILTSKTLGEITLKVEHKNVLLKDVSKDKAKSSALISEIIQLNKGITASLKRIKKEISEPSKQSQKPSGPAAQLRTLGGQFTSLVSIQNILNQGLASQIQKNMGKGDRRDILNYRTGRFAEAARVETMSRSREGMITAFYSYMRNPYATFSFGGAQSSPATRDPKLLISRSIREIGATMVGNRMRAVLV